MAVWEMEQGQGGGQGGTRPLLRADSWGRVGGPDIKKKKFICLHQVLVSFGMQYFSLQHSNPELCHVGSSFLTKDGTHTA